MANVAFIGLGNMGGPMATNLVKAGLSEEILAEDELVAMIERRHPGLRADLVEFIAKLAVEINESFVSGDSRTRVETPMSLRTVLDRIPAGLDMYSDAEDPLRRAWDEFVLPHIDPYDRDHYETVWAAVVRRGPEGAPFTG